jgi:hypothetical protein
VFAHAKSILYLQLFGVILICDKTSISNTIDIFQGLFENLLSITIKILKTIFYILVFYITTLIIKESK